MNFQNTEFDHAQDSRQWLPSETTSRQTQHRRQRHEPLVGAERESPRRSISPQPTVGPAAVPPSTSNSESASEIYGPDRHQPTHAAPPALRSVYNPPRVQTAGVPAVRFDEAQLAMFAAQNAGPMSGLKDELAREAGNSITPGVDESPYVQYAIAALTRRRHGEATDDEFSDGDFEDEMEGVPTPPMTARRVSSQEQQMGLPPLAVPETAYAGHRDIRRESSSPEERQPLADYREPENYDDFRTLSPVSSRVSTPRIPIPTQFQTTRPLTPPHVRPDGTEGWQPVTEEMRENYYCNESSYPPLTYKPRIIRPYSIIIFMLLCIFMVVGLVFSATYSSSSDGLTPYPGTMYSGQYFLFRILPQLLGAAIMVYSQNILSTSLRILPFAAIADEDARIRCDALFRPLYMRTLLYPHIIRQGPWQFNAFSVATWLSLFTVPLLSSVFTCIAVEERWIWATSQGIAWTLVALYIILIAAAGCLMVFWFGKWTGLMWDVRSIADVIPLLNRTNTLPSYKGATSIASPSMLPFYLQDRCVDRLGYWKQGNMQTGSIWYAIGTDGDGAAKPQIVSEIMGSKRTSYNPSINSHQVQTGTRRRYLPWCLTTLPLVLFASFAGCLLLALLIVSFLPQTHLEAGFLPLLSAKPGDTAFSAANFLYSFLPSFLGVALFLLFQSLDQALRLVQPWGELSHVDGGLARRTILADYAACNTPLLASLRAARVGHWRVASVSLLSTLFLFIPVLSGGLFMALTTPSGQVRMFPSIPLYGVLLALLFLYLSALILLLPRRHIFRLPHDVSTLAGIIALCSADDLTQDAAFRSVRSRGDLEMRLGADKTSDPREESVWYLGGLAGKDEKRISVRRMRRFTEMKSEKKRRSFMRSVI